MARTMTAPKCGEGAGGPGVEHIFGYPGGAVLPIYDELFQQDKVQHILVRQEGGAVHAAKAMRARLARSASFSSRRVPARPTR